MEVGKRERDQKKKMAENDGVKADSYSTKIPKLDWIQQKNCSWSRGRWRDGSGEKEHSRKSIC